MFKVQKKACATCIYRKDSALNLKALEAAVVDPHMKGYFKGHRVCHHSKDVCCRGFWNRHKDKFTAGQLAQRLKAVLFVEVDTLKKVYWHCHSCHVEVEKGFRCPHCGKTKKEKK